MKFHSYQIRMHTCSSSTSGKCTVIIHPSQWPVPLLSEMLTTCLPWDKRRLKVPYLGAALKSLRPCLWCGNCGTCPYIKVLRIFSFIDGIHIHFSIAPPQHIRIKGEHINILQLISSIYYTREAFLSHPVHNLQQRSCCCYTLNAFYYFSIF